MAPQCSSIKELVDLITSLDFTFPWGFQKKKNAVNIDAFIIIIDIIVIMFLKIYSIIKENDELVNTYGAICE